MAYVLRNEASTAFMNPWIETPLIPSGPISKAAGCNVYLKLENLQPSGSFKTRGIGNYLISHLKATAGTSTHFYSSSGGNAGLACVIAAASLQTRATVVVPFSTSAYMIQKIREAGAENVIQRGESWAEADGYLRETMLPEAKARGENAVYVPPYDAESIWNGNSTMITEMKRQLDTRGQKLDAVVCSVGGGGLFNGIMLGLEREGLADVPVFAVETEGANCFAHALQSGQLITLPGITSIATSLGARTVSKRSLEYGLSRNVESLVLQDKDAVRGCDVVADKHRFLVETACGVCVAACADQRLRELLPRLNDDSNVVVVLCGGSNITSEILQKYKQDYLTS